MSRTALQYVSAELAALQEDADYQWFRLHASGGNFGELRRGVEATIDRCLVQPPDEPTTNEIQVRLNGLRALCAGTLDRFQPFIARAEAALL